MKKIAILGCENSHASAFLKCIKEKDDFRDIEVVGVYSSQREASEKIKAKFDVPIMDNYYDAVGKIDGLVITARHGNEHYEFAKPYIKSRIPMFIDKPITISEKEAVDFMKELKAESVRISGGSSLKQDELIMRLKREKEEEYGGKTLGGYVRAPYMSDSIYGGFYFYAQHLVEMVCEIFGRYPKAVTAKEKKGQIHVLFHYEDYDCVGLFCDKSYVYFASRMSEKEATGYSIPTTDDWFFREFEEFAKLLHGAPQVISYEDFISPVFIMNAIERSLVNGKEESIPAFCI